MAKIGLKAGFDPIPEGIHVLKIVSVDDSKMETFGKLQITLADNKGHKHNERFEFYDGDGVERDGAFWGFSSLARAALNLADDDLSEVDTKDLLGKYIRCEVTHDEVESKNRPGKYNTFSRLGREKTHAEGFDGETVAQAAPAPTAEPSGDLDLSKILG